MKRITASLVLALLFAWSLSAEDMPLYVPNSKAPLDARKTAAPAMSVTRSEAEEIRTEFGGILYMAQRKYAYEEWPGKAMSDCRRASSEDWCYQCELVMGHTSADYYFYKENSASGCTLQQVDAHFQVADPDILRYLRRPAQAVFGVAPVRSSKLRSKDSGWDGTGSGWKWETGGDVAFLYMDADEPTSGGDGTARFQWRRPPLSAKNNP